MPLLGTDVSKWQGVVDYDAVAAAGVKFAIAKAVHGKYQDTKFATNWNGIKGKLVRGAYAWYVPEQDAIEQADALIAAMVGLDNDDLPPAIDFEQPTQIPADKLLAGAMTFVRRIIEKTGRKPLFYTGKWYWQQYVKDMDAPELVSLTDLWHAEYPNLGRSGIQYREAMAALGSPHPALPWAKRGIAPRIWQFDGDKGLTLPGGQDADFNRFDGEDEEFVAYIASTVIDPLALPVLTPPLFNATRETQLVLMALGYDLGATGADGDFGGKTKAAVSAFQGSVGLPATGSVDDATKAALQAAWLKLNA